MEREGDRNSEAINNIKRQNLQVVKYYNAIPFPTKNLAIHLGYNDETVETYEDSLIKMNWVLAKRAGVKKTDLVLRYFWHFKHLYILIC